MTRINFINEDYEEIESVSVDFNLFEIFTMVNSSVFFLCGKDRLRHEKIEINSIDFKNNEIDIMVDGLNI